MLFGVKLSVLLKAWLALLMETRLMTPASLFLLEAPLPLPNPPVDCDAMLWLHFPLEETPSMKREDVL